MPSIRSFLFYLKNRLSKLRQNKFGETGSFKLRESQTEELKKWPSRRQWFRFFGVLTRKEKIIFFFLSAASLSSFIFLASSFYCKHTKIEPAQGKTYTEGLIGQPRFINPVYANSDVDRDLMELVYSGLMRYDENMNIVPDLAERYEVEDGGKVYRFYLRDNIFWQDNAPIVADDIVFTIKKIQDANYKSPFRMNWVGVDVERTGVKEIKFSLKNPYSAFLERCVLKILPAHIWENAGPENFSLEVYNLMAVGSGPYKIKDIKQGEKNRIESMTLLPNPFYWGKQPFISEIKLLFFNNEEELARWAKNRRIKGLSLASPQNLGANWNIITFPLPRYFAVFFNQEKSSVLAEKDVRTALNHATDKEEIIRKVINSSQGSFLIKGRVVDSPILPEIYDFEKPSVVYDFDLEKAKSILEQAGYKYENQNSVREKTVEKQPAFQFKSDLKSGSKGTEVRELQKCLSKIPDVYPEGEITGLFGEKTEAAVVRFQEKYSDDILKPGGFNQGTGLVAKSTRAKLNDVCFGNPIEKKLLKISLVTVDQPLLVKTAEILKEQWAAAGADLEITKVPISQLEEEFIKPRNYEALLFGELSGAIPDLYPFWHSSFKKDPGLNLALYGAKETDGLLEDARQSLDRGTLAEKLNLFQNALLKDAPAVFLYYLDYNYFVSKDVQGMNQKKITDPSKRFIDIENWYIRTSRRWAPR